MNIFIYNPFGNSDGHSQKYATNIAIGLINTPKVNSVRLYTSSDFLAEECKENGVIVKHTKHNSKKYTKKLTVYKNILYGMWIFLSNLKISTKLVIDTLKKGDDSRIIHFIGGETLSNLIIIYILSFWNKNIFLTLHNADFDKSLYPRFKLKAYYKVIAIIMIRIALYRGVKFFTHGNYMKEILSRQITGINKNLYIHKVPISGYLKKCENNFHTNKIKLAFIGIIRLDKGLDILIEGLNKIQTKNWNLKISGSSDQVGIDYIENIIKPVESNIILDLGYKSEVDLENIFKESNIVVLPYRKSFIAQSVVMTEAICHGKPVIVTNTSENSFDVKMYNLGWVFEAENIDDLARILNIAISEIEIVNMHREEYLDSISRNSIGAAIVSCYGG
jgi:glycosyltransferase involved in cell wall biosynthesis